MKIALIHDALVNKGGAERVFQVFCEIFPDADIYTSVYFKNKTHPYFKKRNINVTYLQNIVKNEYHLKLLFPVANYLMHKLDLEDYDLIFSSSTFCAKYVNARNAIHICYCYTPFRLLWSTSSYLKSQYGNINNRLIRTVLTPLRKWDYKISQKVDRFIAMTKVTKNRIKKFYNRNAYIIPPAIDLSKLKIGSGKGSYYLVVSRLECYKKVDLAIKAFNKLKLPLLIVGNGTKAKNLKSISNNNINFLSSVSDEELREIYQNCIAVIFPQEEDFGLVPLEANASGRPVIAYGDGGILETMIPYDGYNENKATSIFFSKQSVESIVDAVKKFEAVSFNKKTLIQNAKRFDVLNFRANIKNIVSDVFKRSKL